MTVAVLVELELGGVWTDVTGQCREPVTTRRSTTRGDGAFRRYEAGRATIVVDNTDRSFDPSVNPDVKPGVRVRVSVVLPEWAGLTTPLLTTGGAPLLTESGSPLLVGIAGSVRVFTGSVRSVDVTYTRGLATSSTVLGCVDATPRLANAGIPEVDTPVGNGDTVAERVDRVLDEVGWSPRDIAAGGVELVGTLYGQSAWDEINRAVAADVGDVWLDPEGRVAFRPLGDALDAVNEATFGVGGWPIHDAEVAYDSEVLVNQVEYGRVGEPAEVLADVDSQTEFTDGIPATLRDLELPHVAQPDADDWARLQLLLQAFPELRVGRVAVKPRWDPEFALAVLQLDIASRVTVAFQPPGGGGLLERFCWVSAVEHQWTLDDWVVQFTFASASRYRFLKYDDDILGMLDDNGFGPVPASFTGGRYVAVAGETVSPGDLGMLQSQTVLRFATLAELGAAVPNPEIGMFAAVGDTFRWWNGATWLRPNG